MDVIFLKKCFLTQPEFSFMFFLWIHNELPIIFGSSFHWSNPFSPSSVWQEVQLKWAVIKYIPVSLSLIRIRCFSLSCFVHFHWSLCMYLSPLLALDFCYIILLLATWAASGWISGFCLYNGLLDLWLHLNKVPFQCTLSLLSRQHPAKGTPIYGNQAFKFRHHEKLYYAPLAETGCLSKADLRFTMAKSKQDPLWTAWKYTLQ